MHLSQSGQVGKKLYGLGLGLDFRIDLGLGLYFTENKVPLRPILQCSSLQWSTWWLLLCIRHRMDDECRLHWVKSSHKSMV